MALDEASRKSERIREGLQDSKVATHRNEDSLTALRSTLEDLASLATELNRLHRQLAQSSGRCKVLSTNLHLDIVRGQAHVGTSVTRGLDELSLSLQEKSVAAGDLSCRIGRSLELATKTALEALQDGRAASASVETATHTMLELESELSHTKAFLDSVQAYRSETGSQAKERSTQQSVQETTTSQSRAAAALIVDGMEDGFSFGNRS